MCPVDPRSEFLQSRKDGANYKYILDSSMYDYTHRSKGYTYNNCNIEGVVGIPLFMIKNPKYLQQSYYILSFRIVVGISFLTVFLIINSGIPTTPKINITVVLGIRLTTVMP